MAQLKEVRNRISSVKSTQQITKAMKLVAASKLRKAQDKIVQIRPYSIKLSEILSNIVAASDGNMNIDQAKERPVNKVLIVLTTSDRGLCGGFNTNNIRLVRGLLSDKYAKQKAEGNVSLLCIGKKGYEAFNKDADLRIIKDHIDLFGDLTFDNALVVSRFLMEAYALGTFDKVEVVFSKFKNQVTQEPTIAPFLPIAKIEGTKDTAETSKYRADFIFDPDKEKLLTELVPKILNTQFFRYLLDNNASEQGARMTAMDKATENAEELLRDLKIAYNRARQAAITTEIIEIVSGAAALEGGG